MTGKIDPRAPVIVGAGQVTHQRDPDGAWIEPVTLAGRALRAAGEDSGTGSMIAPGHSP